MNTEQLDAFESLLEEAKATCTSSDDLIQDVINLAEEVLGPSEEVMDATQSTGYMHEPFALDLLQEFIDELEGINDVLLSPDMTEKRRLYLQLLCARKAEAERAEQLVAERIARNRNFYCKWSGSFGA